LKIVDPPPDAERESLQPATWCSMFHGIRFNSVWRIAVACGIAVAPMAAVAQADGWRELRIDGSSPEKFQASVAALQNALPAGRRKEFEVALATIWLGNTIDPNRFKDGQFAPADLGELRADSADLLADVARGDLVSAIEELDESTDKSAVAHYVEQLDGLGYDGALDTAGRLDKQEVGPAMRAYKAQILCRDQQTMPIRQKWCASFFNSNAATPVPRVPVGMTLGAALEAVNAGDIAAAESELERLNLNQLSTFDRGMAEALLFHISYRQRAFPKARVHLQAAVEAGVMSEADRQAILGLIQRAEQNSAPDGPSISPVLEQDPTSRIR
jgi:hypothetical protein